MSLKVKEKEEEEKEREAGQEETHRENQTVGDGVRSARLRADMRHEGMNETRERGNDQTRESSRITSSTKDDL